MQCRSRLLIRFLVTAPPEPLDTTRPYLGGPGIPGARTTIRPPERYLIPSFSTRRKSREERSVSRSGSEALPAFETSRLEDRTTGPIVHSMTKTVTTFPATDFWLIGSFHDKTSGRRGGPDKVTDRSAAMSKSPTRRPRRVRPNRLGGPRRIELIRERNLKSEITRSKLQSPWHDLEKP